MTWFGGASRAQVLRSGPSMRSGHRPASPSVKRENPPLSLFFLLLFHLIYHSNPILMSSSSRVISFVQEDDDIHGSAICCGRDFSKIKITQKREEKNDVFWKTNGWCQSCTRPINSRSLSICSNYPHRIIRGVNLSNFTLAPSHDSFNLMPFSFFSIYFYTFLWLACYKCISSASLSLISK